MSLRRTFAVFLSFVVVSPCISQVLVSEQPSSPPTNEPSVVVRIGTVLSRDESGRVSRFTDEHAREFELRFDEWGRLVSANATQAHHISDVLFIGYDSQSRVAGAMLRSGYEVSISYSDDGIQVVRDRYGGVIARQGSLFAGYTILQSSDPTGKIVATVAGLDALLQSVESRS